MEVNGDAVDALLRAYGPFWLGFLVILGLFLFFFRKDIRIIAGEIFKKQPKIMSAFDVVETTITHRRKTQYIDGSESCLEEMLETLAMICYRVLDGHLKDTQRWNLDEIDAADLFGAVLSLTNDAMSEADEDARKDGIHPSVIAEFNKIKEEKAEVFLAVVRAVCEFKGIATSGAKVDLIYRMLNELIRTVWFQTSRRFSHFDERLKGYHYKGRICGE